ncbi:hypothetical protein VCRA2111O408_10731 [Vibrio crassostreae]|nr:hypothetical protein VCRA2111O408_10731 [Vibrio crassostreae]
MGVKFNDTQMFKTTEEETICQYEGGVINRSLNIYSIGDWVCLLESFGNHAR